MAFGNEIKTGNITENWLFEIFNKSSGLKFDGTDDYMDCGATTSSSPLALTSSTSMSLVMWIKGASKIYALEPNHEAFNVLEENEAFIYSYFIQNELFFENQSKEKQKYMSERPSTYEISPQVPGRIGRWLGWKIVSSYMDQNQITLEELLLEVDFKKIFYNSNYKPI